ncbi:MAG: NAD(P)-dependent oxidoreductase [Clostridia bacterium]|nr:NAD(P)-dependent oxidoreductase [Clostridia bacterium]
MMRICLSIAKRDDEFKKMVEKLSDYAHVDVVGLDNFSLQGYDIFIGKKLSKAILNTADRLKMVFAYKTGVDEFPLDSFKEMGIILVNSHIDAKFIAEYAFGLSISLVNRITECDKKLRKGIWYDNNNPYWKSIFDMKVGILGYGHIGKHIHSILEKNDIATYTLSRGKKYENILTVHTIEELFEKSNLIILALPKTPQTDHIINAGTLALLKDKYIVNVGRSNCIVEQDLYQALKRKEIAGAAIDTWDKKPKTKDSVLNPSQYPFIELDNIVLSPHQAMRVDVGHARYVQDITRKVIDYIEKGDITDRVDLDKGY